VDSSAEKSPAEPIASNGNDAKDGDKKEENETVNLIDEKKETPADQEMTEATEDEPMADAEKADDTKPDVPMEQEDTKETDAKPDKEFDLSGAPCRDLLSRKELALCERQKIYPVQYLEIKKVLIHESLVNGLLDKDSSNSSKRTIVKIDVERRGNVIEFLVRAGWISRKLADVAMRVVTPQPPTPIES